MNCNLISCAWAFTYYLIQFNMYDLKMKIESNTFL